MSASRVTIGDVADRAGVSIATVSRVVNGRYGVATATHQRVRAVIDDLGYESSLVARSLRSQRTNVIGILVADIEPFSAELLKGAAKAVHRTAYELIVYSGSGHGKEHAGWERRNVSRLSGTLTDGIILVTPTVVDVSDVAPIVIVDPHAGPPILPCVHSDNLAGAMTAAEYLISLGHRRIAPPLRTTVTVRRQSTGDPQRVARAHRSGTGNELRRWSRPHAGVRLGPEREGRSDRGS